MMPFSRPSTLAALIVSFSLVEIVSGAPLVIRLPGVNIKIADKTSPSPAPSKSSLEAAVTTVSSVESANASSTTQLFASTSVSENITLAAIGSTEAHTGFETGVSTESTIGTAEAGQSNATTVETHSTEAINATGISSTAELVNATSGIVSSTAAATLESVSSISTSEIIGSTGLVNATVESTISTQAITGTVDLNATTALPVDNAASTGLITGTVESSTATAGSSVSVENATTGASSASIELLTSTSGLNATAESTLFTTGSNATSTVLSTIELGNVTAESTVSNAITDLATGTVDVNATTGAPTSAASTELATGTVDVNATAGASTTAASTELATGTVDVNATTGAPTSAASTEFATGTVDVNATTGAPTSAASTELTTGTVEVNATTGASSIGSELSSVSVESTTSTLENGTAQSVVSTELTTGTGSLNTGASTELATGTVDVNATTGAPTTAASTELVTGTVEANATTGASSATGSELSSVSIESTSVLGNGTTQSVFSTDLATGTIGLNTESSTLNGTVEAGTSTSVRIEANGTTGAVSENATSAASTTSNLETGTGNLETTTPLANINATGASTIEPLTGETSSASASFGTSTMEPLPVNFTIGHRVNTSIFDCADLEVGLYGNPKVACDTKFYICVDSRELAYEQPCPARLYFDAEIKVCESWIHIPACTGKSRPTTKAPSNVTFTTAAPIVDCSNKSDGNYPDPIGTVKPDCSNRFYVCIGGVSIELRCPSNLIYDNETKNCERRDRVFACTGVHFNDTESKSTTPPPATLPPVDFDCSNRSNGYYVVNCSTSFFSCNSGEARELHCPHGLVFEEATKACDIPSNTLICTGTKRTTKIATTTEASNVTTGHTTPSPMDCSDTKDGIYPDPLKKCSREFYFCAHNDSFRGVCPANLFYDVETKRCDLWLNVFACSGRRPTPPPKRTRSPPPVFPVVDFDCTRREDGNYVNPKDKCSKFYYTCANMEAFQQDCPAELYYDPHRDLCDSWMHIFDCSGVTAPPSTSAPNVTHVPTEKPDFDCSAKLDGTYQNSVNACSHIYYQCVSGHTYDFECPANLYFDEQRDRCENFNDVFACSGITHTPSKPSSKSTPKPTPPELPLNCMFLADGDYQDPQKNCSNTYYSCAAGYVFSRKCPHGTFFDSEQDACESFANVHACTGKPRKTTPTGPSTKHTPRPVYPFDCMKQFDGNYQAADCTQEFWSCVGGLTFPRHCLFGLVYDAEFDDCEFPFLVPKCGGKRVTHASKPISTTRNPLLTFDCARLADGNYPDPQAKDNCSNIFFTCANGITSRLQCPGGLFYDHNMNSCDRHDDVAACSGKSVIPTSSTPAGIQMSTRSSMVTEHRNETATAISGTGSIGTGEITTATSGLSTISGETGATGITDLATATSGMITGSVNETSTAGSTLLTSETTLASNETTVAGTGTMTESTGTAAVGNESTTIGGTELSTFGTTLASNESTTAATGATASESTLASNETTVSGSFSTFEVTETRLVNESSTIGITTSLSINETTAAPEGSTSESVQSSTAENVTGTAVTGSETTIASGTTANVSLSAETTFTSELSTATSLNMSAEQSTVEPSRSSLEGNLTSQLTTVSIINGTEILSTAASTLGNLTGASETTISGLSTSLGSETTTASGLVNATSTAAVQNGTETSTPVSVISEILTTISNLITGTSLAESSQANNATTIALSTTAILQNSTAVAEISTSGLLGNTTLELISASTLNPSTETVGTGSPPPPSP